MPEYLCRRVLEKAVAEGLIRQDPAAHCKLPSMTRAEMRILTREEMQKTLIQAKEEGYYEVFLLEFATGLREGELAALQWDDLNFQTGELRVSRQAGRVIGSGIVISEPKTVHSIRTLVLPPTGLRTCEVLGLLNSDIDLDRQVIHLQRGVKEIAKRNGTDAAGGMEMKVGKLKTASSKRDVPLNQAAVDAILELRAERYFGENSPLIADENGNYTKPVNFRKCYYRILKAAGIEQKGLHSLRHTFATNLVNGVKQSDGTIKALSPRQVADLLGHSTSEITELYYVKRDTSRLAGITAGFEL